MSIGKLFSNTVCIKLFYFVIVGTGYGNRILGFICDDMGCQDFFGLKVT